MKNIFGLALAALFAFFTLDSSAKTLTAKRNGAWNSAATWQGGNMPEAGDDVIISGFVVTINGTHSCKSLTLNDASATTALTINAGASLTVSGSIVLNTDNGAGSSGNLFTVLGTLNANGGISFLNESEQLLGLLLGSTNTLNIGNANNAAAVTVSDIYTASALSLLALGIESTVNQINFYHGNVSISGDVVFGDGELTLNNQYNVFSLVDEGAFKGKTKNIFYSSPSALELFQGRFEVLGLDGNTDYTFTFNGVEDQFLVFDQITYKDVVVDNIGSTLFVAENLASQEEINTLRVKSGATLAIVTEETNIDALSNPSSFILESNARLLIAENGFADGIPSKTASQVATDAIIEFQVNDGANQSIFQEDFFYPIVQLTGSGTKTYDNNSAPVNNTTLTAERIELLEGTWNISEGQQLLLNTAGNEGVIYLGPETSLQLFGDFNELSTAWEIDRDNTFRYAKNGAQNILSPSNKQGMPEPYGILSIGNTNELGSTVTLPQDMTVEVANELDFNGNANLVLAENSVLQLNSDVEFTAFVSAVPDNASIRYEGATPGKFVVEKYLPLPYRAYRDVTSPVKETTLQSWLDKGIDMRGFPGSTRPGAGKVTVTRYNEQEIGNLNLGFEDAANANNAIRVLENDIAKQSVWRILDGNNSNLNYAVTLADAGEIYTGNRQFEVTFTPTPGGGIDARTFDDGWNLLGNPYPASLDWDEVLNDPDNIDLVLDGFLDPTVYILSQIDRFQADPNNPGFYGFYNASTGFRVIHDDIIPSYQGFWVKSFNNEDASNSFNITIKEDHKSGLEESRFYKNTTLRSRKAIDRAEDAVEITIFEDNRGKEKVWFHYWPGATVNKDTLFDVAKFGEPSPNATAVDFADENDNFNIWVNALPDNAPRFEIPLYVQCRKAAEYRLDFTNLEVFTDRYPCAYLLDVVTGQTKNLSTDSSYTWTTTAAYAGNRFKLFFNQDLSANISSEKPTCAGQNGKITFDFSEITNYVDYSIKNVATNQQVGVVRGTDLGIVEVALPAGQYLVTNATGLITCSSNNLRVDINPTLPIIADFSTPVYEVDQFDALTFNNASANAAQFLWSFEDDGSISTEANPTHVFNFPGVYEVSLVALNEAGNCENEKRRTYTVNEATVGISELAKAGLKLKTLAEYNFEIEGINSSEAWEFLLSDLSGKTLFKSNGKGGSVKFNIADFDGMLMGQIQRVDSKTTFKILK